MSSLTFPFLAQQAGRTLPSTSVRPIVCIQGLGFVGMAMAVAVAQAKTATGEPIFNVVGVDLDNELGRSRAKLLNQGLLPMKTSDTKLTESLAAVHHNGNLIACTDPEAYALADTVIIDIHFDLHSSEINAKSIDFDNMRSAVRAIASRAKKGTLVLVETTVPPGTCQKIIAPEIATILKTRNMNYNDILLAHSYERVMPGKDYLDSIVNFWRVYAADSADAAKKCDEFLSKIINVKDYPLTRLSSTLASETAKVLENSYRAVNIAFMEEWGRFAETAGIDIFEIVEAIRKRDTHSNIRQPGFGVGGYCLTKDPLFAAVSNKIFFEHLGSDDFPFCRQAVAINKNMPHVSINKLEKAFNNKLENRTILLLGVTYRPDVADTRHSPSVDFWREVIKRGAHVQAHDPLINEVPELKAQVATTLPAIDEFDAIVFAVGHSEYSKIDFAKWLGKKKPLVLDANNILTQIQRQQLKALDISLKSIGRGEI